MIWSTWLQHAANALGTTSQQAGVILSLVFTSGIMMAVLIGTRGRQAGSSMPPTALMLIVLFTYMEWLPVWTGAILGLMLSLFIAQKVAKAVS